jgi:hypothetical protein
MVLRAVLRGRYRQIEFSKNGGPVEITLYGCQVVAAPADKGGKTYMTLDISGDDCGGDVDMLHRVDDFVAASVPRGGPAFSPLLPGGRLVVKLPAGGGVRFETATGDPAPEPWAILTNAIVDVVIRPGAFGTFGYCWLLQRIKPAAAAF